MQDQRAEESGEEKIFVHIVVFIFLINQLIFMFSEEELPPKMSDTRIFANLMLLPSSNISSANIFIWGFMLKFACLSYYLD